MRLLDDRRIYELFSVEASIVELKPQPARDIRHRGMDRARRADVRILALDHGLQFSLHILMRRCNVFAVSKITRIGHAVGHAQRLEDAPADEIIPAHAADRFDDHPGGDEHEVGIAVPGAEIVRGRYVAQTAHYFFGGVTAEQQHIACPGAKSAAMA